MIAKEVRQDIAISFRRWDHQSVNYLGMKKMWLENLEWVTHASFTQLTKEMWQLWQNNNTKRRCRRCWKKGLISRFGNHRKEKVIMTRLVKTALDIYRWEDKEVSSKFWSSTTKTVLTTGTKNTQGMNIDETNSQFHKLSNLPVAKCIANSWGYMWAKSALMQEKMCIRDRVKASGWTVLEKKACFPAGNKMEAVLQLYLGV